MSDNDNRGSNAVSFAMGTAIGTGIGMFLSTRKGKKMIKKAWKYLEPYLEDVVDTAKEEYGDAALRAEEVRLRTMHAAESTIGELKDLAGEKLPPVIKKSAKRSFFKGV